MSRSVVIVGGGVIGLCSAYYAAKQGIQVTVLERDSRETEGCSFGNAGMIVPSHFIPLAAPGMVALGLKWMWNPESPFYIKPRLDWGLISWAWKFMRASTRAHVERCAPLIRDLSFASRSAFEELAKSLDFGLVQRGLLMLCKTAHALDEEAKTAMRANDLGVPAQVLDARNTATREPGVTMDIAGSVYFPQDCHLSPNRLMAALRTACESLGAVLRYGTEVSGWRVEGRRVAAVETPAGEIVADDFVLCGGSWSTSVARDLRVALPMQAGKGYSVTLHEPRQLPEHCAIFCEARVAVTPMGSTLRFGGTMEIAGLNLNVNPRRVQGIIKAVPRYFPEFQAADFAAVKPWRGLRPCSPDGMPYLGRLKAYDNLVVATGHAMMGLSLGPVTGKLVATLLAGEKPELDLALMTPDRYA